MKNYRKACIKAFVVEDIRKYIDKRIAEIESDIRAYETAISDAENALGADAEKARSIDSYKANIAECREAIAVYYQSLATIVAK